MTETKSGLIKDMLFALAEYECSHDGRGKLWLLERLTETKLTDWLAELRAINKEVIDARRRQREHTD